LTAFHNARWANTFLTTREVIASMLGRITRYEARMDRNRPNRVQAPGESYPNRMKAVACCLIWALT